MASLTPRASGLWADSTTDSMGHIDEDSESDDLEQQRLITDDQPITDEHVDCRTPLDKTIDRIGMGA